MNQKTVEVELLALNEQTDVLRFKFDSSPIDVNLNDASSCQNSLKSVFATLIDTLFKSDLHLEFIHADDYKRNMYIEVCQEYIDDLNREILSTKEKIQTEFLIHEPLQTD